MPGVSRALPTATALSVLEINPKLQRFSISISDRKDFYHQFQVSRPRAWSNALWPPLKVEDVRNLNALESSRPFLESKRRRYDRRVHGDLLGGGPVPHEHHGHLVQACFASIPQGDHLGVEFATSSHRSLLKSHGLLSDDNELRADQPFRGERVLEGLAIDDYYAISIEDEPLQPGLPSLPAVSSQASSLMARARLAYDKAGILGSSDKDVCEDAKAKVTGAELDSSLETRRLGLALLGAPVKRRLALSFVFGAGCYAMDH